jgi:hypothetical protein
MREQYQDEHGVPSLNNYLTSLNFGDVTYGEVNIISLTIHGMTFAIVAIIMPWIIFSHLATPGLKI